ncbi:MAG: DUF3153 domain-containing protein [Firmicutes bacterium]|nr:DUF3153 domain-containing protein [Bacillota bacterium]
MKKHLLIMLALIFIMSGCGSAQLGYEITGDNQFIIQNYLQFDTQTLDAGGRELLADTVEYWRSLGFTIYPGITENEVGGRLHLQANSSRHLEALVESNLTGARGPFSSAQFRRSGTWLYEQYSLDLAIDLGNFFDDDSLSELPEREREFLSEIASRLDEMDMEVQFTLPGRYTAGNAELVESPSESSTTLTWSLTPGYNQLQATTRVWIVSPLLAGGVIIGVSLLIAAIIFGAVKKRKQSVR